MKMKANVRYNAQDRAFLRSLKVDPDIRPVMREEELAALNAQLRTDLEASEREGASTALLYDGIAKAYQRLDDECVAVHCKLRHAHEMRRAWRLSALIAYALLLIVLWSWK